MGVHALWSIVEPVRESVPLYSLSGKTLAVDLSLWVCEAQQVQAMMGRVTKPHLRNLFFRVSSLTLMGVKLVFVVEGEAPKIKADTMNKRTQGRYGGANGAAASKSGVNPNRGRFRALLRECAEMLDYLGVPWVTAAGEAEAMCAYLDSQGLVDGCITNDGDAFLYGARTVYRNFNMNNKDPQIDCYQAARVQSELHLSRENLVGLAILLGCDYIPKGIPGVGREQALKLIHSLTGQSLLQRFTKWKEEVTDVSAGAVKKVSHCNICQHPGSAKAHERDGCMLCHSQRFCQPQDFDYQCPCDWHCYEKTRQGLTLEANIKRKALASQQFPFTEVICEFLVSKDKPVSHFKRRQPNMLLMQRFAFDKMGWMKHYTSDKVLILLTYSEMMNRKYGRDAPSQIKPLRILKPRVRNGIACFEVIWRSPEHFVFPEDWPAESQHEVRTVEEESLFRVAFPEVVGSYLRDKALAEDNKPKKKKSKSEKEKPVEACDGISHLLARMNLQSSSSATASARQPPPTPVRSVTVETEVVILDSPVNQKQIRKEKEDGSTQAHHSDADSGTVASPSNSVVIDALHLSDIDWDALSFTSSPTAVSQTATLEDREQKTLGGVRPVDPELSIIECSLRDRLLMKNTAKAVSQVEATNSAVPKPPHDEKAFLKLDSDSNPKAEIYKDCTSDDEDDPHVDRSHPLVEKSQCATNNVGREAVEEHKTSMRQTESRTKEKLHGSEKSSHKYKVVKKAISSLAAPPQRCHSDPGRGRKDNQVLHTTKKSVCMSVCSSSDDSDTEIQRTGPQRGAKSKNKHKPLFVPASKPQEKTSNTKLNEATSPLLRMDLEKGVSVNTEHASQDVPAADVDEEVFLQTPASPAVMQDDDSVTCSDSPLPLAERLRLKFIKEPTKFMVE